MADQARMNWLARIFGGRVAVRSQDGTPPYTVAEVKRALRAPAGDGRSRRVHDYLARLGARLDDLDVRRRFRGLEDYHSRLLRILTLYCRGWETERIAASLSLFSTAVGVEEAINAAALVIAEDLNRELAA